MCKSIIIEGKEDIRGKIAVSGSKNAALPCLAASLLSTDDVLMKNIPNIDDVKKMLRILESLGVEIVGRIDDGEILIQPQTVISAIASNLAEQIRGSMILLGSLLARTGKVTAKGFGGCDIGPRPIDIHLDVFKQLGADVSETDNGLRVSAPKALGGTANLRYPSVGATQNGIVAASTSPLETVLNNIALEPEVIDLANMLSSMGVRIEIDEETRRAYIQGTKMLGGAKHEVIPDRIEAGTYAMVAAASNADIEISGVIPEHLTLVLETLSRMGIHVTRIGENRVRITSQRSNLKPVNIATGAYPGFPTDLQPQFTVVATQANGCTHIVEKVFERRFNHINELNRMGAKIELDGVCAIVNGPTNLIGEKVVAKDLRGGAALLIAGVAASGESVIKNFQHLERGYEDVVQKLNGIGVQAEIIFDGK